VHLSAINAGVFGSTNLTSYVGLLLLLFFDGVVTHSSSVFRVSLFLYFARTLACRQRLAAEVEYRETKRPSRRGPKDRNLSHQARFAHLSLVWRMATTKKDLWPLLERPFVTLDVLRKP